MKGSAAQTTEASLPLPEEATAFLERVTRGIGSGPRVAAQVRRELTDHFEDALDGVDSPEKRTVAVQRLVQDFGDEDLLATLIRRGKRRCDKGAPSTMLGIAIASGIILLVVAMGGAPPIWVNLPSIFFSVGLIVAPTLTAYGFRALCHALWVARALILDVDPESVSKHDPAILWAMVQRGYIAAGGGFLLGLIVTLASSERPATMGGGMAMGLLAPLCAGLISEGALRPAARRVEALHHISELAVPVRDAAAKGEQS